MGKMFDSILPEHEEFLKRQRIFFVGSAPLAEEGHVNLSPKGYDSFRILSSTEVAYLDLTGSGNETSAHIDENGRITFMFVAFEGPPMIMRLYGKGSVVLPGSERWDELIKEFDVIPGIRQIICATIHGVQTSCGYSIPFYSYEGERETLRLWATKKKEEEIKEYQVSKNSVSLDGIVTPLGKAEQHG
ncbi:pyridoxamine 5'-phosphate oxidase family protein [Caldalkalibacillus mannanilyticus]|uniref:pyridoxamine 5'-phosphate oxidase family protein n=1 Tax=Caldalkalibacillus mannanilyticus TaxID=1418 RepID=UPI00046B0989|nr:pyridoxamine 5'-phosphate oxidase family protein [Caldalkalibacillus mannanilyticus]